MRSPFVPQSSLGPRLITASLVAVAVTLAPLLAVGSQAGVTQRVPDAPSEIVIGASIPETGTLAAFGLYERWGYQAAIADVNRSGGVYLSKYHKKLRVNLILYDDESQPQNVTQNTERLVLRNNANALLGSATPPLVLAGAQVAERDRIPMVTGIAPIRAFLSARPHWNYVWDIFFDELDMTTQQFKTMHMVGGGNHRVALFTDNEQDGVVMGGLWTKNAPKYGFTIAYHASFPVGTTDFGDLIRRAQGAHAQIVIAQMITPDAIALWKQMKSLNYRPTAAFIEKGAEPVQFWQALGGNAQGVMVAGYWYPTLPYFGAKKLKARFESETHQTYSQHIADTYAAARVLLDAMSRAGTLDASAVNAAIGKTNKQYVVGRVNFAKGPSGHASPLPTFMLQWQHGETQIVYPARLRTARIIYPLPAWSKV
jgi:branched-chain amino acid transport system substrate-binding protein